MGKNQWNYSQKSLYKTSMSRQQSQEFQNTCSFGLIINDNTIDITIPIGRAVNKAEYQKVINSCILAVVVKFNVVTHAIILSITNAMHKPNIVFSFIWLIFGGNVDTKNLSTNTEIILPSGATHTTHNANDESQE